MNLERARARGGLGLSDLGVGLGLRTKHYAHVLEHAPHVDFFEIISENFLRTRGRPVEVLDRVAECYPIVMHGVSLSIGSTDPLDFDYLRDLAALRKRARARWLSDHLCWTGVSGRNTHDLLPVPYDEATLAHVAARVRVVQDFLGERILLENPSTYVELAASTMTEAEFLSRLVREADCGLLLDVNNVYVSARNHGFDPYAYLSQLPLERVGQIHVAGHTDEGTHLVDTHVGPVPSDVWALCAHVRTRMAQQGWSAAILLEWDTDIPEFSVAHADALRAHEFLSKPAAALHEVQP